MCGCVRLNVKHKKTKKQYFQSIFFVSAADGKCIGGVT
jgi:hypothetical protein